MLNNKPYIIIFSLLFLILSCQNKTSLGERFCKQFFLMDTLIEITIIEKNPDKAKICMDKVFNEFKRLEKLFTGYDSTGDVWKINKSGTDRIKVNDEIFKLISTSQAFSEMSEGAFDISVWPLIRLWGFGFEPKIPDEKDIKSCLYLVDYKNINLFPEDHSVQFLQNGMGIDLGGIAKGYSLDKAASILKNAGIKNFLINAGGDIIASGIRENGEKWRIGIKHPRKDGLIETLEISDCAVVTSGDYERFFIKDGKRYHHILNPITGYSAKDCISVTVITHMNSIPNSATVADALSTAIFVLGHKKGIPLAKTFNSTKVIIITPELEIIRL
ncbi:MAG: FAD:protein FMN transferase [Candidatus Firestonebacteria bacterium]|nr:FAD:protein FMN transferase [Candidatus Firestonebacteria bacterium]